MDDTIRFKVHALSKVKQVQSLPEDEWARFNRPDNVNITYTRAADELVSEGALEKTDDHGYRPGPNFEEALVKYDVK